MNQEDYRACMSKGLKDKAGLAPEERKEEFCIQSQLCSGKAKDRGGAKENCAELARNPKPPKPAKTKKFCFSDLETLATCTVNNIDLSKLTPENMQQTFSAALRKCSGAAVTGVKAAKKTLKELTPEELEHAKTIALIAQQFEGKQW